MTYSHIAKLLMYQRYFESRLKRDFDEPLSENDYYTGAHHYNLVSEALLDRLHRESLTLQPSPPAPSPVLPKEKFD